MNRQPKVSVLIPTYNYAHYLDETIQSVLDQTFTDFELIIVDNCSTDNTDEVVKKYLTDIRVSFHKNETNVGLVGNWNKCLDYAKGEYIKFLCADDKFHPQLLEKFVAIMEQYPGVSIISCYNEIFGERNFSRISPFKGLVSSVLMQEDLLRYGNRLRNPSVVIFRKFDVKKVGKFNPQLLQLTDKEYYYRLLTVGDCYIIPETLCYVRAHQQRQSVLIRGKKYAAIFERYRFMISIKQNTPKTNPTYQEIETDINKRAIRCAAVMYEVLPTLYKKESRKIFKTAFQIASSEDVVYAPLSYYLKGKYLKKLLGKSN